MPLQVDSREDVIVTDVERMARSTSGGVAFVSSHPEAIVCVLDTRRVLGVIHPDELSENQLAILAAGSKVFSTYTAEDWRIDPAYYELIRSVAYGLTRMEAARQAGYSERHARRILAGIAERARVGAEFSWAALAPLLAV